MTAKYIFHRGFGSCTLLVGKSVWTLSKTSQKRLYQAGITVSGHGESSFSLRSMSMLSLLLPYLRCEVIYFSELFLIYLKCDCNLICNPSQESFASSLNTFTSFV